MASHDYVIANGTGSAVRSDLNSALAAIVSNNSGSSEPATMYAYQWWADTTSGSLKQRNAANNAWITIGTLASANLGLVPLSGAGGTPSSLTLTNATGLPVAGGGTGAATFAANGVLFGNGTGAVGVTAVGTATHVLTSNGSGSAPTFQAASSTSDKISEGNTEAEVVDTGSDGHFKVTTEGTERFRVDASGRLLVGTSTSDNAVSYADNLVIGTTSGDNGMTIVSGTSDAGSINFSDGSGANETKGIIQYHHSSNSLASYTNGTERLRILSDGTITTGGLTSTPGTVAAGSFVQAAANAGFFGNNGDAKFGSSANNPVLFQVNGSEKARIDTSGNVGIGTSSPNSFTNYKVLTIQGTTASGIDLEKADGTIQARFFGDATGVQIGAPAGSVRFETANTERMRILSDGNCGLGTSSPAMRLDVKGTVSAGSGSDEDLQQWNIGSNNVKAEIKYVDASASRGMRFGTSTDHVLTFQTNNTERMKIANAGETFIYSSDHGLYTQTTVGAGTSKYLYRGANSSGANTVFNVWSNGNVESATNSYGSTSDLKLKENIVDANSQWNDIKNIRVRNYNFKEETGQETHKQLGVVAQEIEAVSPGLVIDRPDFDDDGTDLGTVTKAVNYSVLYMKAVKALQEAMDRIETLEQRLSDAGIA